MPVLMSLVISPRRRNRPRLQPCVGRWLSKKPVLPPDGMVSTTTPRSCPSPSPADGRPAPASSRTSLCTAEAALEQACATAGARPPAALRRSTAGAGIATGDASSKHVAAACAAFAGDALPECYGVSPAPPGALAGRRPGEKSRSRAATTTALSSQNTGFMQSRGLGATRAKVAQKEERVRR